VTLDSRSTWLLGRCSRQLRKSCAGANMAYSQAERVFILEHYFASKSSAAVREAFRNAYPHKKIVYWLAKKFNYAGSVCLWQVLIERKNSWNYGHIDFKQCISCNNGIQLQEFNIATGFVVFCVKGCFLNGLLCSWTRLTSGIMSSDTYQLSLRVFLGTEAWNILMILIRSPFASLFITVIRI
jgi:hypothetical protein